MKELLQPESTLGLLAAARQHSTIAMVGFSVKHLYVLFYNVRPFDLYSWKRQRLPRLRSRRDIIIGGPRHTY